MLSNQRCRFALDVVCRWIYGLIRICSPPVSTYRRSMPRSDVAMVRDSCGPCALMESCLSLLLPDVDFQWSASCPFSAQYICVCGWPPVRASRAAPSGLEGALIVWPLAVPCRAFSALDDQACSPKPHLIPPPLLAVCFLLHAAGLPVPCASEAPPVAYSLDARLSPRPLVVMLT